MKKVCAVFIFTFFYLVSFGSHIVGGEFEIVHLSKNIYRVNLIMYFDVKNGNIQARDNIVLASIFRKRDRALIRNIALTKFQERRVDYFQPECSTGEVVTDKIIYSGTVILRDEEFNDQEGYYLAWQRCCRNYTISNIYSDEPGNGISAGQTFYLEFPAIVDENGDEFINNTPQLFPPLNDYACPNRPYWVDFAGVDLDGDSLVYELSTPLSTQFSSAFPPGNQNLPAPYPTITWRPGFSKINTVNGFPDLKISDEGFLTVTPLSQGLFVFAVRVSEFRNGKKIGEVRRDFQLWVVDKCPVADPPVVKGKKSEEADFTYQGTMNVTFERSLQEEERCIEVQISDLDALKVEDGFREDIWVKAIPLNFKGNVEEILPSITKAVLINGSTFNLSVCFPECPYKEDGPFQVGIVAFDDACALPLSDTLKITVNIEPPPNQKPYFVNGDVINKEVIEQKDGFWSVDIIARDDDLDSMTFMAFPQGFALNEYGMSLTTYKNTKGEIKTRFDWNYDCLQTSFDGKNEFQILFIAEDIDQCLFNYSDTLLMNLKVILPENTLPEIYTDLGERNEKYFKIQSSLYESVVFNTISEDLDNDPIVINGVGSNFSFDDYEIIFPETETTGNPAVQKSFTWNLSCTSFKDNPLDSFRFYLMVEDFDYCNITSKDSITIDLIVEKPNNKLPEVTFTSLNPRITVNSESSFESVVFNNIQIEVTATDSDPNNITLELWEILGKDTRGFTFNPASGYKTASSILSWTPQCFDLNFVDELTNYLFVFRVTDDDCRAPSDNLVNMQINLKDIYNDIEIFNPPNFFSPNSDSFNNFFAVEWIDESGNLYTSGLPKNSCVSNFEEIKIVNRSGREVFTSKERDFKWFGDGQPAGVYYYYIKYSDREFKGNITMLY